MNAVLQGKWSTPDDHVMEGEAPCPFEKRTNVSAMMWGIVLAIEFVVFVLVVL